MADTELQPIELLGGEEIAGTVYDFGTFLWSVYWHGRNGNASKRLASGRGDDIASAIAAAKDAMHREAQEPSVTALLAAMKRGE
jgi:hypothetical protein